MKYITYGSTYELQWRGETITVKREMKNGWGNGPLVLQGYHNSKAKAFEDHMGILQEDIRTGESAQCDFMVSLKPTITETKKKELFRELKTAGLKLKAQVDGFLCYEKVRKEKPVDYTVEDQYWEIRKMLKKQYPSWSLKGVA